MTDWSDSGFPSQLSPLESRSSFKYITCHITDFNAIIELLSQITSALTLLLLGWWEEMAALPLPFPRSRTDRAPLRAPCLVWIFMNRGKYYRNNDRWFSSRTLIVTNRMNLNTLCEMWKYECCIFVCIDSRVLSIFCLSLLTATTALGVMLTYTSLELWRDDKYYPSDIFFPNFRVML